MNPYGHTEEITLKMVSEAGELSVRSMMEITGASKQACAYRLRNLLDRKVLYIARWERGIGRGAPAPFFAIGCLTDAKRPAPLTNREIKEKWLLKPESRAKIKKLNEKSNARHLERTRTDPEYAEANRKYQREWLRKKFGYSSRDLSAPKKLDELAMQFGITWRFQKTRRKAA